RQPPPPRPSHERIASRKSTTRPPTPTPLHGNRTRSIAPPSRAEIGARLTGWVHGLVGIRQDPGMSDPGLIVGAGPVGLGAACELAGRGAPVRIFDKLAEPTRESRAVLVHARSLEALARIGVVEEIVAAGRRTLGMEIHADRERVDRFALDTVDSPYPFSV